MARIIHEVRPRYAFVENSPMLTSRGLGRVLGDLANMGFDARWGVLGAADVGANHQRDRIWIVAKWRGQLPHTQHNRIRRWEQQQESIKKENGKMANSFNSGQLRTECLENNSSSKRRRESKDDFNKKSKIFGKNAYSSCKDVERQRSISIGVKQELRNISNKSWWEFEPNVGRVADGVAARVHRLKAIGNGQVPLCAATAWRILSE
jgi:DNA (cytosine-5)-methyltransferase 1